MSYPNLQSKLETLLAENGLTGVEKDKVHQFIGMLAEFVSPLFRRSAVLTIPKEGSPLAVSQESVMRFLQPVVDREEGRQAPSIYVDKDLWHWFRDMTVPGMAGGLTLCVYRFLKDLTHRQILDEGQAQGVCRIGTLLEALAVTKATVLAGEVDQFNTGVLAYFKVDGKKAVHRLSAWRSKDGQLCLRVNQIPFDDIWDAGGGVLFSN